MNLHEEAAWMCTIAERKERDGEPVAAAIWRQAAYRLLYGPWTPPDRDSSSTGRESGRKGGPA